MISDILKARPCRIADRPICILALKILSTNIYIGFRIPRQQGDNKISNCLPPMVILGSRKERYMCSPHTQKMMVSIKHQSEYSHMAVCDKLLKPRMVCLTLIEMMFSYPPRRSSAVVTIQVSEWLSIAHSVCTAEPCRFNEQPSDDGERSFMTVFRASRGFENRMHTPSPVPLVVEIFSP